MDAGVKGIRIDWHAGTWRLWDVELNVKYEECTELTVFGTTAFQNTDNHKRGYAITNGTIERAGDHVIVRSVSDGESRQ